MVQSATEGATFADRDPATGETLALCALGSRDDVDAAVATARAAQPGWAELDPAKRARILHNLARLIEDNAAAALPPTDRSLGAPRPGNIPEHWGKRTL